jgi:putative hemolysin
VEIRKYKTMSEKMLIDIDAILASKAGKKARYVPRFLVSYLKKIVHQEELNGFLENEQDKYGVEFIEDFFRFFDNSFEVEGMENLPAEGWCTFVSNHPLGALDGMGLGMILGKHYDEKIKYLVNDLLMNIPQLKSLFIPINKTGRQAKNFPRQVDDAFKSENHILMFPAGICSRRTNGVIRDLEWKKTFITKSIQTERDIVPIHFEGRNSDFFYNLANVNKMLGIKFNIAMLYLADEMFKNRGKKFKVTIGKPISWQTFDKSRKPAEWAQYVQDIVYSLNRQ